MHRIDEVGRDNDDNDVARQLWQSATLNVSTIKQNDNLYACKTLFLGFCEYCKYDTMPYSGEYVRRWAPDEINVLNEFGFI